MSERARFPLVAKMMVWLAVYLLVLAGAFLVFLNLQLERGLDSILSGAAAERLQGLGGSVAYELRSSAEEDWDEIIQRHLEPYGVEPALLLEREQSLPYELPSALAERLAEMAPHGRREPRRPERGPEGRPPRPGGRGGPGGPGGPRRPSDWDEWDERPGPPGAAERRLGPERIGDPPTARPLFLTREEGAYWAAIDLPLFTPGMGEPRHGMLVLRSESISAGGLFFDVRPWILGGLAVLALSLVIWAPFGFSISRYVSRLSRTTEAIALGNFDARVGARRSDELGSLGRSIEKMSARLDRLVRGQKRFLGDVAHELCAPLARVRTGLGVLEHGIQEDQKGRLASIEEDAQELSDLIAEVLAFTKASTAPGSAKLELVELSPLVAETVARETPEQAVTVDVAGGFQAKADRALLGRVLANLMRNAHHHGGADCRVTISAKARGDQVEVIVEDDGPGVPDDALPHLFEPFYRPDSARTREEGGAGLGMAIVRSGVEACGGSVRAERASPHGLRVVITLSAA